MQNQKKFEDIVQIYLTSIIFDLLGNDTKNLLYCSKYITNTIVDHYIKNKQIGLSTAKKMTSRKQQYIKYIFVDIFLNLSQKDLNFTQFSRLTYLKFDCDFNQPLKIGVLPDTLTYLSFGDTFNQPLEMFVLPSKLTHLEFGNKFNQPLEMFVLPSKLTHLEFGNKFNQLLKQNSLPPTLICLKFGKSYNKPLKKDVLPSTLTHLEFGVDFKHRVYFNNLLSLTHLKFGFWYNWISRPIGPLPISLKYLQIPEYYKFKSELPNDIEIKYTSFQESVFN